MTVPKDSNTTRRWRPQTEMVRGGQVRSGFDETSEALYLTSGYVYSSAEEAEAAFKGDKERFVYSRYANPTVSMFEDRLRILEGAEACRATASGMGAVFASLLCQLKAGDRVVASRALFGSCHYIVSELLPRYGIDTQLVDGTDLDAWEAALAKGANCVFLETPSNPTLEVIDLKAGLSSMAHGVGATVVVDNVFATPMLQRPLDFGADVVVYSATKHIDGQGRTMGGAILSSEAFIKDHLQMFYRHTGPSMSPFNAWVMLKGLETLDLRVERHCANALAVARAPGTAAGGHPGALSRPGKPSPGGAGQAPDEGRQQPGGLRGRGRQGPGLPPVERPGGDRHLQQPGRRQEPGYPSGDHDPSAPLGGGAGPSSASARACCASPSAWRIRPT